MTTDHTSPHGSDARLPPSGIPAAGGKHFKPPAESPNIALVTLDHRMCHHWMPLLALCICLCSPATTPAGLSLEEAIDAHVQGRQLAHQASATITASNRHMLEGVVVRPKQKLWTLHWAQGLDMERVRYDLSRPDRTDIYDWFMTPAEVRMLRNWPDESPPVLTPSNQHAVRASIWPNDSSKPAFDATTMLLRTLTGHPYNQRWGLEDLARHALSAQLLSEDATSLDLAFELPPAPESKGHFQYTITLDKSANFSISKVVGRTVDTMLFTQGKEVGPGDFIVEWEVTEFADLGDGIYLPSHVSQVSYGSDDRCGRVESEYEITDLAVNEDVDPALFDFSFPENVLVVYGPAESPDRQKVVLWGPDDKPARVIQSVDVFADPPPSDTALAPGGQRPPAMDSQSTEVYGRHLLFAINLGIIVAVVSFMAFRRLSRKGAQFNRTSAGLTSIIIGIGVTLGLSLRLSTREDLATHEQSAVHESNGVRFAPDVYRHERPVEAGTIVTFKMTVQNTGNEAATIYNATTSCHCLQVSASQGGAAASVVPAGESAELELTLDTSRQVGLVSPDLFLDVRMESGKEGRIHARIIVPVSSGLAAHPFQFDVADAPVDGGPVGSINLFSEIPGRKLSDYTLSLDGDNEIEVRSLEDFEEVVIPEHDSVGVNPRSDSVHIGQLQVVLKGPCDYGRSYRSLVKLAAKSESVAEDVLIPIHVRTESQLPRLVPDQIYVQAGARARRTILIPGTDGDSRISARSERVDLRIEPDTTFLSTPDGDTRRLRSLVLALDGGLEVGSHEVAVEVEDTRLSLSLHVFDYPMSGGQVDDD